MAQHETAAATRHVRPQVTGAILAGGTSRRMGRDKRWLHVDGVPLLRRVADVLGPLVDDLHIVVADAADRDTVAATVGAAQVVLDRRPGQGPLAGIETALTIARHEVVVLLAADHPHIVPAVVGLLIDTMIEDPEAAAVALDTTGGPQPLLAAYRRRWLAQVTALLDRGERRAAQALTSLDARLLAPATWQTRDPDGRTMRDLDTPADLAALTSETPGPGPGRATAAQVVQREVVAVRDGIATRRDDHLVDEEPLEILLHGPGQEPRTVVTTMRTRGHDQDLAAGWLTTEGLLADNTIVRMTAGDPLVLAKPEDQLTVEVSRPVDFDAGVRRHTAATASCGVCGRASIDALASRTAPIHLDVPGQAVAFSLLAQLPDRLRAAQPVFAQTGAIHATGLFTLTGELATLREDVGRHNALDAAIGAQARRGALPLSTLIGVLSGRVGFELVAKAAAAGLPILAAVGAPTALAVQTAARLGVTLVGFLRGGNGNIYTHPERVQTESEQTERAERGQGDGPRRRTTRSDEASA